MTAAASLYREFGRDLPYCFNRKEAKDHGEGGAMVGYKPQDGDRICGYSARTISPSDSSSFRFVLRVLSEIRFRYRFSSLNRTI